MTHIDQLVDQHIREYESRVRHFDELLERAASVTGTRPEDEEVKMKAEELQQYRDEMVLEAEKERQKANQARERRDIKSHGPMGVWDAVAQELEHLLERNHL